MFPSVIKMANMSNEAYEKARFEAIFNVASKQHSTLLRSGASRTIRWTCLLFWLVIGLKSSWGLEKDHYGADWIH